MAVISDLKIAFIGVGHWHTPLYIPAVNEANLKVVAVSDENSTTAERYAKKLSCKAYTDPLKLMDTEHPDFLIAFAKHSETAQLCVEIINRGIAFSIEKPMMNVDDVRRVKDLADQKHVFCSIPFTWRYSQLVRDLKKALNPTSIENINFVFMCGHPDRYLKTSPWVLEPAISGGGVMNNCNVHFIDMAFYFTESTSAEVLASAFQYGKGFEVEDYGSTIFRMSNGTSVVMQIGYAFPDDAVNKYDNRWNIATKEGYITVHNNRVETRIFGKPTHVEHISTFSEDYYPVYVQESLQEYLAGKTPTVGLSEMLRTRIVMDDIIKKAKEK
jgi:predicted dehydrogenase